MDKGAKYRELQRWIKLGPGFLGARRRRREGRADYKTIDEAVDEVLEETGADRVNLLGHSFGGLLAMDYALDNPDKVEDIVTVASAYSGTFGIYWSNAMRLMGLYDPVLYDMLLPGSKFISRLNVKMGMKFDVLCERPTWVTNFVALEDEFVQMDEQSLMPVVGKKYNVTETGIEEGHCEVLFHDDVVESIGIMAQNGSPVLAAPPIMHDKGIFREVSRKLGSPEGFYTFNYDYLKMPETRYH